MQTQKLVIDSSIWIASLVFRGESRRLLARTLQEGQTIVASEAIFSQVRRQLKAILPELIPDFEVVVIAMQWRLQMVELGTIIIAADVSDHRRSTLESAIAGNATIIVTGDRELLSLGAYQGVLIIPPHAF